MPILPVTGLNFLRYPDCTPKMLGFEANMPIGDLSVAAQGTALRRGVHSFQIVAEADETPFGFGFLFSSHGEPAASEHFLDDPEDGFDGLLSQSIERLAFGCFQTVGPPFFHR
jgi:hypothetical protein